MSKSYRYFFTWSEAAAELGFDDEGLRQAMLVELQGQDSDLWLPVAIDADASPFIARLEWWDRYGVDVVNMPRPWEVEHQEILLSDGGRVGNCGNTGTAWWDSTGDHRTGWSRCVYLGGKLILAPSTVRYSCEAPADLQAQSIVVAPREWCADGFREDEGFYFVLVGGDHGYRKKPEHLYTATFFYADDVKRVKDALAGVRQAKPQSDAKGRWPWGTHTTTLLDHFAAAADKFWRLYDPSDTTTAPTNDTVASWLVDRGVAQRVAECMAQILRADGLKAGPRR